MKYFSHIVTTVILLGFLGSCVTNKKITYLQVYDEEADTLSTSVVPDSYHVLIHDNLYIRVITPDPRWSSMFNTTSINSALMSGEAAIDLISYSVQADGTVDIPFVGPLEVAGFTIPEVKQIVDAALTDYITDADITVKLVNNYVSIIGEVNRPGLYPIYKEKLNIFQAMSLAGDIAQYGERRLVSVVRQTPNGSEVKEFNLTDRAIIDSEYYYVMPNDVIYAKPIKGKFFQMNSFPYALILSTVTTFILLLNIIRPTP